MAAVNSVVASKYVPPAKRRAQQDPQVPSSESTPPPPDWRNGRRRVDTNNSFNDATGGRPMDRRNALERNSRWNSWKDGDPDSGQSRSRTGTGWDVRDGRQNRRENESEIFKSIVNKSIGVNFDSYEAIPVEVSGRGHMDYTALGHFNDIKGVHSIVATNIQRVNYQKPTPVQKHAVPVIGMGRDLMACAQTGSGKTAAFLLPIISNMLRSGPPPSAAKKMRYGAVAYPVALVFSPTRELACQTYEESRKFAFSSGIRTVVLYGGTSVQQQSRELSAGCDICVATPGRLDDLNVRGKIDFSQVSYLVLDEADRMLDMGFEPKISELVLDTTMKTSEEGRQTVMFSATFPREIQMLASRFLSDYIFLTVGRVGSTNDFIDQQVEYVADCDKNARLIALLTRVLQQQPDGLVLVFVETKRKADTVEVFLLDKGLKCTSIHGDRDQSEREFALKHFRSGVFPVLVATDVAARGLDIPNICCVINLDLPSGIDDYVHRIGRTGRAGNHGKAISFVNENNANILRALLALLEEASQEVPAWFTSMVRNVSSAGRNFMRYGAGNRGGNRYGGSRGGSSFGGRDIRSAEGPPINSGGSWRGGDDAFRAPRGRGGQSRPNTVVGGRPVDEDDGW